MFLILLGVSTIYTIYIEIFMLSFLVFLFSNSVGGRRMNVVRSIGGMTVAWGGNG